ncbi:unnamed protein product, partial [Mesorhabditis spiculigera]
MLRPIRFCSSVITTIVTKSKQYRKRNQPVEAVEEAVDDDKENVEVAPEKQRPDLLIVKPGDCVLAMKERTAAGYGKYKKGDVLVVVEPIGDDHFRGHPFGKKHQMAIYPLSDVFLSVAPEKGMAAIEEEEENYGKVQAEMAINDVITQDSDAPGSSTSKANRNPEAPITIRKSRSRTGLAQRISNRFRRRRSRTPSAPVAAATVEAVPKVKVVEAEEKPAAVVIVTPPPREDQHSPQRPLPQNIVQGIMPGPRPIRNPRDTRNPLISIERELVQRTPRIQAAEPRSRELPIPAGFMERVLHNESQDFYFGAIDHVESAKVLDGCTDGTFFVRYSNARDRNVLVLRYHGQDRHIVIETDTNYQYWIDEGITFKYILDLVIYYRSHDLRCCRIYLALRNQLNRYYVYTAQYDFKRPEEQFLELKVGDVVHVISTAGDARGWWRGVCGIKEGYFPFRYVNPFHKAISNAPLNKRISGL